MRRAGFHGAGLISAFAGGGGGAPVFTLTATTAGAGNVTIDRLTPSGGDCTIDWGDGSTSVAVDGGVANHVHAYGAAGVWRITVNNPALITQLDIRDGQISNLNTAELAGSALTYFIARDLAAPCTVRSADMTLWMPTVWWLLNMPAGVYTTNSSDMALWTPASWRLSNMPAGTYTIDSAHMSAWGPTFWYLFSMPAGTYTINISHMSAWTPTDWQLRSVHAASLTLTVASADLAGWTTTTLMRADDNGLLQADVNSILYGMYRASIVPRTVAGGTINVGGTNAAPSGVFQAAAACPVDAATPGKEVAHELLNDGCGVGFNVWAAVTFTP